MKKNIIIAAISAASAILLAASCQKQTEPELIGEGKTFTAVIEQGLTKTTITSEYKVNWEAGDQIDINGTTFSATPDATDATKASFTKVSGSDPIGEYGYTAVYPASIMVESQPTLPATQTYAAGKFNAPMCAMSDTETLEFKNFCGVLCFALKGTDKVRSIVVTANEQICGPFDFADATVICFSGENEGYTVTLDCGTEGIQLNEATATNFYIYLPQATYTAEMKMTITNTNGKTFEKTTTKSVIIERSNIYTFNWTPSFASVIPAGALPRVFSVSNDGGTTIKQVHFSQGNLWYGPVTEGAPATFNFEANQYDTTPASEVFGIWSSDHISHFYWSKDASVAYAEEYEDDGTSDQDVFFTNDPEDEKKPNSNFKVNVGGTDQTGWRTLSPAEWQYLFNNHVKVWGQCNSVNGYFIAPDGFVGDASTLSSLVSDWTAAEAAGIVFLPAAGRRNGFDVDLVGYYGSYWSSTARSVSHAYHVDFFSDIVYLNEYAFRNIGFSVRLITECQ